MMTLHVEHKKFLLGLITGVLLTGFLAAWWMSQNAADYQGKFTPIKTVQTVEVTGPGMGNVTGPGM